MAAGGLRVAVAYGVRSADVCWACRDGRSTARGVAESVRHLRAGGVKVLMTFPKRQLLLLNVVVTA
jgi:hypothetical protein